MPFAHLKRSVLLSPLLLLVEVLYILFVNLSFLVMACVPRGDRSTRVLRVQDVPYKVLLVVLQYMYNCLDEIDEAMLMDVFRASRDYGIPALHNDCLQHLTSMIDLTNSAPPPQLPSVRCRWRGHAGPQHRRQPRMESFFFRIRPPRPLQTCSFH